MRRISIVTAAIGCMVLAAPAAATAQTQASEAWGRCLGGETVRRASGPGAPAMVADAAMRACRPQEMRARAALARAGSSPAETDRFVQSMRENMRQLVIRTRGQSGAARPSAPPRGDRPAPPGTAHAFTVVNHHNSPVTRFQIGNQRGTSWSSNWLRVQVAPFGRQNLRFTNPAACRQRVRVVFADQRTIEDQVNFCGTSYLNVSGRSMWAE